MGGVIPGRRHASRLRLLLSIHDVSPRFEGEIERLLDLLTETARTDRIAMLVVPDHWGSSPIIPGTPFASRLRRWSERGAEIFVHGWYHYDRAVHRGKAALKARWMTAGEGEFLGLSRAEARKAMSDGKSLLEDVIGVPVAGFIAPAWLYSPGSLEALRDVGFAIAEDHGRVWSPTHGDARLAGGPVVTWASRTPLRFLSSLAAAAVLRRMLSRHAAVRVAVHPSDLYSPALLSSIERTVGVFALSHRPSRYADLAVDRDLAGWRMGQPAEHVESMSA